MVKEPNSFIEKMPLSEKVYRILAKKIIDGKLVPGTKLKEKHVAEELGVSPTPVREAFKKLSGNGFVEINPYNGAVVKGLDEKEINDVYRCREALENFSPPLLLGAENKGVGDQPKLFSRLKSFFKPRP